MVEREALAEPLGEEDGGGGTSDQVRRSAVDVCVFLTGVTLSISLSLSFSFFGFFF